MWISGSDVLAQTAAALAAISLLFQHIDAPYAAVLESHARDLYVYVAHCYMQINGLAIGGWPGAEPVYLNMQYNSLCIQRLSQRLA